MPPFHGAFVLRTQGYGILSGTYFNTDEPKPYPETAILKPSDYPLNLEKDRIANNFIGDYESVWLESGKHVKVRLIISPNKTGTFDLNWMFENDQDNPEFKGLGILENDLLIGCYWYADQ